jgi:transposase-like protein
MKPKRKGRPSKYSPKRAGVILAMIEHGLSQAAAAAAVGIAESTLYLWRRDYSEFSEALTRAAALASYYMTLSIRRAADAGEWRAAAWWLTRRRPDEWGSRTEVTFVDTHPVPNEAPADRDQRIRALFGITSPPGESQAESRVTA